MELYKVLYQNQKKRKWKFNDGLHYSYTLNQIKEYATTQHMVVREEEEEEEEQNYQEQEDNDNNNNNNNGTNNVATNESDNESDSEEENIPDENNSEEGGTKEATSNGIYLKKMLKVPLEELQKRKTARVSYDDAINLCIEKVSERFGNLDIDGRKIDVRKWPSESDIEVLTDAIEDYDPDFSRDIRSSAQAHRMPLINEFLTSSDHYRETLYCIEFRLCGKDECNICKQVGRSIRTPMTEDGKLRKEVCKFLDLPVLDSKRQNDHFLSPEMTRKYFEKNNPTLDDLKKTLMEEKNNHVMRQC